MAPGRSGRRCHLGCKSVVGLLLMDSNPLDVQNLDPEGEYESAGIYQSSWRCGGYVAA
jgi:hypothetical protein